MKRFRSAARLGALVLPVLVGLTCLSTLPVDAQSVTGTILGIVRDSSGAVVPGVTVALVNSGTGATRSAVTNAQGEYTAPALPTGTYSVSAEMSGFKKVTLANVHVGVDQRVRADLKLDLGEMTEAVEIQAETPLVQTASSDLSVTVEGKTIESLPLNGRNFVSLTRTIPGVTRGVGPGGGNIDGSGSLAWRASASFSANGQRPRDNNYLLDGVDNNETWLQTVVVFPSVDALDEFKLQTSTYAAEFGRSMGGVVNLQIKSGTNAFHGSGFEFLRNDRFDANNWFNNRAGRPKPEFSQHQFGGTIGGPIIKDKTFFFADYQGMRITQGQTYLSTMPSEKMRQGDFSEINRPIYDPLTGQPFPGNIIPESRWDPASKNVLQQLIPAPNTTGTRNAARPADQQLPDQPGAHAAGQPVRREGRPRAEREQPLLPALQLPEDPPRPARDPAARGRQRHVRRRRREHQGPELRLQRHPHLQRQLAQRGPRRVQPDQVQPDPDRLRREPGRGDGHSRRQHQLGHFRHEPDHLRAGRSAPPGLERRISP